MKLKVVSICLIVGTAFVSALLYFDSQKLVLSQCADEEKVETWVQFVFDYSILNDFSIEALEERIDEDLALSNLILANSCVPMIRKSAGYEFFDAHNAKPEDMLSSHYELNLQHCSLLERAYQEPNFYVVLVLSEDSSYFDFEYKIAETWVDLFPNFVVSDVRAGPLALEHELGHLAWAQHDLETLSSQVQGRTLESMTAEDNQLQIKRYAHAALCGDSGTIMSYEKNIVPIYSSPNITYQGRVCGDAQSADNARLLTEYARALRAKVDARSW